MSSDAKPPASNSPAVELANREKGVRIFTYPKLIFIFPTLIMAVVCWIGMMIIRDSTERPSLRFSTSSADAPVTPDKSGKATATPEKTPVPPNVHDFRSAQNLLALGFLGVWAFNMLILTFDFPRYSIVAIGFLVTTAVFFLLWLGMITDFLPVLFHLFQGIYVSANAGFYLTFALIILVMYAVILVTRWLDYWEFRPNEILHHHGPWSDLERFPTMNLKFDKEIPDIFEHLLFGSGRLVFHVSGEQKAIILDNVLYINKKEEALKLIMSRLSVRVTTDQEAEQPLP